MAADTLRTYSIEPRAALCVGNDMLNDICPAQELGFRTALFAGDARSLRLRENDPRTRKTAPELILTELRQLEECIFA